MELALTLSEADNNLIENYAAAKKISVVDFIRSSIMEKIEREKEKEKAEYWARIDASLERIKQGKSSGKYFETLEDLRRFIDEH